MRTVGQRIKELREQRGLTQSDLAKELFDRTYISRIESGKLVPPLVTLELLADRMSVPLSVLIDGDHGSIEHLRQGRYALREGVRLGSIVKVQYAWDSLIDGPWSDDLLEAALFLVSALGYRPDIVTVLQRTLTKYYQAAAGETPWELMVQLGNAYFHLRQWEYAVEAYNVVLRHHPPADIKMRTMSNLATTYLAARQIETAQQMFDRVLSEPWRKTDLLVARCHHGLGTSYRRMGHLEEARRHTIQSLTLYRSVDLTKWHEAYHNLGIILANAGRYDDAEAKLVTALAYYQEHRQYATMASALVELTRVGVARKDYVKAMDYCNRGLGIPTDQVSATTTLQFLQLKTQILPHVNGDAKDLIISPEMWAQLMTAVRRDS